MLRELVATVFRSSHGMGVSTPGRAKRGVWAGKTIVTGHKVSYSNRRYVLDHILCLLQVD